MKALFAMFVITFSFQSFALSVVDSMYESPRHEEATVRTIASQDLGYCMVGVDHKVFAKSCYSSAALCEKRKEFWKDLPGSKQHFCLKM